MAQLNDTADGSRKSAVGPRHVDVAVIGAGAAGLVAALVFARDGYRVLLAGSVKAARDGRTVALLDGSVSLLKRIGAWDAVAPHAAPLATMRIIDDKGSLVRPPPVAFDSAEIGLPAFGYNVENADLVEALAECARQAGPDLTFPGTDVVSVVDEGPLCRLNLGDGEVVTASLVVAADGRRSPAREATGIATREWSYPQVAVTLILTHRLPHRDTSTEFHTREGAFTLVPLPSRPEAAHRSSLVWMMAPERADRIAALDDSAMARAVEDRAHSLLGAMAVEGNRGSVPMGGLSVRSYAAGRIALVGEAAHVFPPIGAQGLNLGLRDIAALRDAVVDQADPGDRAALASYDRGRRLDVGLRTRGVDLLNRSLLSGFLPVDVARGIGLSLLDRIGPLRRAVMRSGLAADEPTTPSLMRRADAA